MGFWQGLGKAVAVAAVAVAVAAVVVAAAPIFAAAVAATTVIGAIAYTAVGAGIVTAGLVMGAQATSEIISSDNINQYIQDSNETVLKGKYAENMTTLGMMQRFTLNVICPTTLLYTCGQNIFYNANNWKGTPGQVLETGLDALGFFVGGAHAFRAIKNMKAVTGVTGKTPRVTSEAKAPVTKDGAKVKTSGADKSAEGAGKTYKVDPSMQAKDIEMGVLKDGSYIKNPTAQNMNDLIKPGSNYVGNSQMNGQYMYVVDANGNIVIGSRAGQHMPHPTLIGGQNPTVQGAGIIDIRGGKIFSIDNASGHFKPDASSLTNVQNAFNQLPTNVFHKNFQGFLPFGE